MGVVNVTPIPFPTATLHRCEKAVLRAEHLLDEGATSSMWWRIDAPDRSSSRRRGTQASAARDSGFEAAATECRGQRRYYKGKCGPRGRGVGAEVVNDVSGFRWDPKMRRPGGIEDRAVLMHTRGRPEEWPACAIGDPVLMVKRDLRMGRNRDPGGVKRDHSYSTRIWIREAFEKTIRCSRTSRNCSRWISLLAGVSRKSFVGRMLASDARTRGCPAPLWHSGCRNGFDPEGHAHIRPTTCGLPRGGKVATPSWPAEADIGGAGGLITKTCHPERSEGPAFARSNPLPGRKPSESNRCGTRPRLMLTLFMRAYSETGASRQLIIGEGCMSSIPYSSPFLHGFWFIPM